MLKFRPWEKLVLGVAIVNFVTFIAMDSWLGGDALNGRVENGHYLLGNHGTYTEVSHAVFTYSQIHATSIFVTHALAFCVAGLASWRERRRNPE
jgi:hypothetical protein